MEMDIDDNYFLSSIEILSILKSNRMSREQRSIWKNRCVMKTIEESIPIIASMGVYYVINEVMEK
jgi:hypothetical protein